MNVQVIHFTEGAADPLRRSEGFAARLMPLADASGRTRLSCLHLAAGSSIHRLPVPAPTTLLIVHGRALFTARNGMEIQLDSGVGVVLQAGEDCGLASEIGAVIMLLRSQRMEAHQSGISSPDRLWGQRWPGQRHAEASAP